MIIITYMNYLTLNKAKSFHGSRVNQDLWQSVVFLGLLVMGVLSVLRF